jgi:hypothetical protein
VNKRVIENILASGFHHGFFLVDIGSEIFITEADEIWEGSGTHIPIATTVVFETGNLVGGRRKGEEK